MTPGVQAYQVTRPLFFAVAIRLDELLGQFFSRPRVFILRLRLMSMIDALGVAAFSSFFDRAHRLGIQAALSDLQQQLRAVFVRIRALEHSAIAADVPGFDEAVPAARRMVD